MIGAGELREVERQVLGSLMLRPALVRDVLQQVHPDDFSDARMGAILEGIAQLVQKGEPVDSLVVFDKLLSWDVRGLDLSDLASWVDAVSTPEAVGYHAATVREAAVLRGLRTVGERLVQNATTADEVGAAIAGEQAKEQIDKLLTGRARQFSAPRWLGEVLNVPEELDRYEWVIPGLMERRDRLMLTGSEGGGKSTFVRQLAVCAAAGVHPFTQEQVEPMRVLVVDVENSERQWRRQVQGLAYQAAQIGARDPREGLALECRESLDVTKASELADIHRAIDLVQPDIVAIGPVYKLSDGGMKNDEDALPVLRALDSIRDRNVALLIEAHAAHADGRTGIRDLRPIGSSAQLRWPEFGLGLAKPKQPGDPFSIVRWRGDREWRPWPKELNSQRSMPQRFPWEPTGSYWANNEAQQQLI